MVLSWPKADGPHALAARRAVKRSAEPGLWEGQITAAGEPMAFWLPAEAIEMAAARARWAGMAAVYGIVSGMAFGVSAIGYRGGILGVRALGESNFAVGATSVLVLGLLMQVAGLTAYLVLFDRAKLMAIFRAWRPSVVAGFMGAFASQFWFLAFAVESAARIRTLALVEIFFAQLLSRTMFKQGMSVREAVGIALILAGVAWLLGGT